MFRVPNAFRFAVLVGFTSCVIAFGLGGSGVGADSRDRLREKVNEGAVTILSGAPAGTYLSIASDLAAVLDKGDAMRVVPMIGKGGAQNVRDLVLLSGVDMAIVQSNALEIMAREDGYKGLPDELRFITRLYDEELHLLARNDIASVADLNGKRVNMAEAGSGSQLTARDVFEKLGVKPIESNFGQNEAFEKLKAGELDATFVVAGKPARGWGEVEINRKRFHLVPLEWSEPLQKSYLPAKLTHDDYPNLLSPGESVETVAAGAVLAAPNSKRGTDRHKRLARFVEAFFSQIDQFRDPARHPKWQETNLAAAVPGWMRFDAAAEWLERNNVVVAGEGSLKDEFDAFLAGTSADLSDAEKEALFDQFLQWRQSRDGVAASSGGERAKTQ